MVIDDFHPDPHAVRARYLAHADAFERPDGARYPGRQFEGIPELRDGTVSRLEALLDRRLAIRNHAVRVATVADYARDDFSYTVHLDFTPYTAIVYLGLVDEARPDAEHPEYGTCFYEHVETGERRIWTRRDPDYEEQLRARGLGAAEYEAYKERISRDFFRPERWRVYERIPYKFNRMVLQDASRLYHSGPDRSFGVDLATGRMTENFFLRFDLRGLFEL